MRFLSTLLISLCCLAAAVRGNAAGIPVKPAKASTEYHAVEQSVPNDALNDYHQISSGRITVINNSFQKEHPSYFSCITDKSIIACILNNSSANTLLSFSGDHAKAFRAKLIFPQHYYW
jgi:hypothetical protein